MILDLFKTKKIPPQKTTYLFKDEFIDIHSHILPGLDDGALDIRDSIEILKKMRQLGFRNFVFTPHVMNEVWENTSEQIIERFYELKTAALQEPDLKDVRMRVAAEYMLDEYFLELLHRKDLLTIKDNMILIELSSIAPPLNLFELIYKIKIQGYVPILAHPERCISFHKNEGMYCKLKSSGCLFQVNLLSFASYYSKEIQNAAMWLLHNNLIDFVGSDVHRLHQVEVIEDLTSRSGLVELLKPIIKNNYQLH